MTDTSFLDSMLRQLRAVKHSALAHVSMGSGVPVSTLRKIRYGEVRDPRVQTVQALHDYFCRIGAKGLTEVVLDHDSNAASTELEGDAGGA